MKLKRLLSALLCLCLAAGGGFTAAAEQTGDTFDYRAYANIYPDLKAAYGYDAAKLYAHYVNFGKAEGRVGSFLSGANPKDAPVFGVLPAAESAQATVPATLLDPLPPVSIPDQPKWRREQTTKVQHMSNAKLVAEYISTQAYLQEARTAATENRAIRDWLHTAPNPKANWLNKTVTDWVENQVAFELKMRLEAIAPEKEGQQVQNEYYQRAMATDTAILTQHANHYEGLSAPPADPGTPGKPPVPTVGGFSDVPETAYFAQPVVWAVEKQIASGTEKGNFSPSQACTQAQILTFLWRASGSPKPEGKAALPGVKETAYYYQAALWAKEQGLIGEDFSANTPCTRAMAMTYLWKQAGSPEADPMAFPDVPEDAEYAPAVAWAAAKGLTGGAGTGGFSPNQLCTRGQIVTFLYRAFGGELEG